MTYRNRYIQRYSDLICGLAISIFVLISLMGRKIQLIPDDYNQEITLLIFGRLKENLAQHPLFYKDSFVPLLHYIPPELLNSTGFVVLAVVTMAIAPWVLMFLTLRKLSAPPLAALLAVIVTFYLGSNYALAYLQEPNPFMMFQSINFRMIVFPLLGLFTYLCATKRWLLAGLAMGLLAASHAKFGAKLWLLTTLVFLTLAIWRSAPHAKPSWKVFLTLQVGFGLTFAYTGWQLVYASTYFAELPLPRAEELVSPFGYLLKNEPDDFLFLFNSSRQVYGAFLFILIGGVLSLWLTYRGNTPTLRGLATIGVIVNGVSLLALTSEVLFEKIGMSLLPSILMHKVLMLRPWDFLWVAPFSIGVLGSLSLAIQPRRSIGDWTAVGLLLVCIAGAFRSMTANPAPWSLLDSEERTPSAVPNYAVLRICSQSQDAHERAKAKALEALWERDRESLEEALETMDLAFRSANDGKFAKLTTDPEADNLRVIFELREGNYAQGYADLLTQNRLILNPAPDIHSWMGDIAWECSDDTEPETISFERVVSPWEDFANATEWIRTNTPPHSRIIHLPSLAPVMARTKRVSFWETKIDSHPMYSFPGYYGIGLDRLQAIAGPNSIELTPGFRYGDPGETGRQFFLSLTKEDLVQLNKKYGTYEFILTERQHQLNLPLVYSNDSFAIYRQVGQP